MRLLLAMLAVLGLVLSPAAAAAGTAACAHHGEGAMVMSMAMEAAAQGDTAPDHSCCDDQPEAPPKHDSKACAQACALMCVSPAALIELAAPAIPAAGHLVLETSPSRAFHAHAPPGLKRPPRTLA